MIFKGSYSSKSGVVEVQGFETVPFMHLYFPEHGVYSIVNRGSVEFYSKAKDLRDVKNRSLLVNLRDVCSSFMDMRRMALPSFKVATSVTDTMGIGDLLRVDDLLEENEAGEQWVLGVNVSNPDYQVYDLGGDSRLVLGSGNMMACNFTRWDGAYTINVEHFKSEALLFDIFAEGMTKAVIFLTAEDMFDPEEDPEDKEYYQTFEEVMDNMTSEGKDFSWLLDRDYTVIEPDPESFATEGIPNFSKAGFDNQEFQDNKKYLSVFLQYLEAHDLIAFDTETTGLEINVTNFRGEGDKIAGLVFSVKEGESFYVPLYHHNIQNVCEAHEIGVFLHKRFKKILETKKMIAHNASFDWSVLWAYGISPNIYFDTFCGFKMSEGLILGKTRSYGLKQLTEDYLGRNSLALSDLVAGTTSGEFDGNFRWVPAEVAKYYACADTDNTLALYNLLFDGGMLRERGGEEIAKIESRMTMVVGYQTFYGHHTPMDEVPKLNQELEQKLANDLEGLKQMLRDYGYGDKMDIDSFNPGSSQQVTKILFGKDFMALPVTETTSTGNPSAGKKVLEALAGIEDADGNPRYPFVRLLSDYKKTKTLHQNFSSKLDQESTYDGLRFNGVDQFLETGRMSVSKPNYQSYDDRVKKYITPRPGFYAADADYSSVEYRIMACMAGETELVEKFFDPDMDIHRLQASKLFDKPYDRVTSAERKMSKGFNFGLAYGMGDAALGKHLWGEETADNTAKAAKMRRKFFNGQERLEELFDSSGKGAVANKFSATHFGRRRYFLAAANGNRIHRQGGNHRIQGTAADIFKLAMIRLFIRLKNNKWMGRVLISTFVHDETFVEVHESINPPFFAKNLREVLMVEVEGWCPLYTGMGFGSSWYEAKSVELPVQVQEKFDDAVSEHQGELSWWTDRSDKAALSHRMSSYIGNHYIERIGDFIDSKAGVEVHSLPTYVQEESVKLVGFVNKLDEEKDAHIISMINWGIPFEEFKVGIGSPSDKVEDMFLAIAKLLGKADEGQRIYDSVLEAEKNNTTSLPSSQDLNLDLYGEEETIEVDPLETYKRVAATKKEAASDALMMGMGLSEDGYVFIKNTGSFESLYTFAKELATSEDADGCTLVGMYPATSNLYSMAISDWKMVKAKKSISVENLELVRNKFLESLSSPTRNVEMLDINTDDDSEGALVL